MKHQWLWLHAAHMRRVLVGLLWCGLLWLSVVGIKCRAAVLGLEPRRARWCATRCCKGDGLLVDAAAVTVLQKVVRDLQWFCGIAAGHCVSEVCLPGGRGKVQVVQFDYSLGVRTYQVHCIPP
jgi:hypothetical protein